MMTTKVENYANLNQSANQNLSPNSIDQENKSTEFTSSDEDEQILNQEINNQLRQHFLNQKKKVLFIINPASGAGRAINVFERKVVPVLKQSQIQFEVVVTTKQGSAFKFLKNLKGEQLFKWSGIVVVSGDGLLFEVFNSLMNRPDWKHAIKLPIGIIPGGSGNGLSYSISHAVGDSKNNQILAAAYNVISGKHSPLDLIRVKCDRKTYYSFLSIGWGLLSDIDIESESLRLLGGHRFSVWAIVRALGLRKYSGKLKFKLFPGYTAKIDGIKADEFRLSRTSSACSDIQFNENDQVKLINYIIRKEESFLNRKEKSLNDDSFIEEIQRILNKDNKTESSNRLQINGNLLNNRNDLVNDSLNGSSRNSSRNSSSEDENSKNDDNNNSTSSINGVEAEFKRNLVKMDDNWVTVKGDFVMVYAVSTSHISSDCHFAPGAKLDDGIIWLLFLKGDIGRKDVVKFLLSLEKGNHVKLPFVHLVPVSEFTLESYSPNSKITVDGELVNTSKVHCEMMPCVARIMTK